MVARSANADYDLRMALNDRLGRDLRTFLIAEIARGDVKVEDMITACGISPSRYYTDESKGTIGRRDKEDFPNTEELLAISRYFNLDDDGYLNLLVEFGIIEPRTDLPGFTGSRPPLAVPTKTKSRKFTPRDDATPM